MYEENILRNRTSRVDSTGTEFIGISSEIIFTEGAPRSSRACRNLEEIVNLFVTEKERILS